jgi:hypothetical protein
VPSLATRFIHCLLKLLSFNIALLSTRKVNLEGEMGRRNTSTIEYLIKWPKGTQLTSHVVHLSPFIFSLWHLY